MNSYDSFIGPSSVDSFLHNIARKEILSRWENLIGSSMDPEEEITIIETRSEERSKSDKTMISISGIEKTSESPKTVTWLEHDDSDMPFAIELSSPYENCSEEVKDKADEYLTKNL